MGRRKKTDVDKQGWGVDGVSTVTTHDGPQSSSMTVAPEATPPAIVLPPAEEALSVLEKLALQNQRVETAKRQYDDAAATAKARKGTWERESSL